MCMMCVTHEQFNKCWNVNHGPNLFNDFVSLKQKSIEEEKMNHGKKDVWTIFGVSQNMKIKIDKLIRSF